MINAKAIAKAVKELAKSDRVYTRRLGDRVYMCNGYYAVYLHVQLYNELVRPVSAKFPDLPNEDCGSICNYSDPLPTLTPNFMHIEKVFECTNKASAPVEDTGYLKIFPQDAKKRAKVLLKGDTMIFVSEKFYEACSAFSLNNPDLLATEKDSNGNAPIYSVTDDIGFLLLPIRRDREEFIVKRS